MTTLATAILATAQVPVPDAGPSNIFLGLALLSLGIMVRYIRNLRR
jgi:hypothetical protein